MLLALDEADGHTLLSRIYKSDYTNNYMTGVLVRSNGSFVSSARVRGGIYMMSSGSLAPGGTDLIFTNAGGTDLSYKSMFGFINYHGFGFGQDTSGNIYSSCYVSNANTSTQNDSFNIRIQKYDPMGTFLYETQINNLNIYSVSYSYIKVRDNVVGVTGSVFSRNGYLHIGNNVIPVGKDSISTFVGSIIEKNSVVTGKVFYDTNGNGIQDAGEFELPSETILAEPGSIPAFTSIGGTYHLFTDTGSFTLSLQHVPRYHVATPPYSVHFSDYGQRKDSVNFALSPIPNINDLRIIVSPFNVARPGSNIFYFISYSNVGTTTLSGSYGFKFTDQITFLSSSAPTSFLSSDSAAWSYSDLRPGEVRYNIANFNVKTTTPIRTILHQYGYIYPITNDSIPSDNIDSVITGIRGPFDPNNKTVDPSYPLVLDSVRAGKQFLNYLIQFQNTGTDTAFQIRVVDTLGANLDVNSFEFVASSHPCQISLTKPGIFEFYFPNINLPDSNTNEFASHGFVRFKIKPITSVAISDTIYNASSIYFDYNTPVKTNTDSTTFRTSIVTSVGNLNVDTKTLKLFPNPTSSEIIYQLAISTRERLVLKLYDLSGRILLQKGINTAVPLTTGRLSVGFLKSGVYILELSDQNKIYQGVFAKF